MKIVRTKSIPNVDADRLRDSLAQLHAEMHTPEGIRTSEYGHGKKAALYTVKTLKICTELRRRGEPTGVHGCRWCSSLLNIKQCITV